MQLYFKNPSTVVFLWIFFEVFKNTYFVEHLRGTTVRTQYTRTSNKWAMAVPGSAVGNNLFGPYHGGSEWHYCDIVWKGPVLSIYNSLSINICKIRLIRTGVIKAQKIACAYHACVIISEIMLMQVISSQHISFSRQGWRF